MSRLPASLSLIFLLAVTAVGQSPGAFDRGNEHYRRGEFAEAVAAYNEQVTGGEWTATLFYNLGNAQFRAGNAGAAALCYERALALDPSHPEAQSNLRTARDLARGLVLQPGSLERIARTLTLNQYTWIALISLWFALFAAARLFFSRNTPTTALAFFAALVAGAAAFAIATLERGMHGRDLAIITGKEVTARVATADTSASVLLLPPGSQVKLVSERGGWSYAILPNNLRGWIPSESVQRVRLAGT